MFFFFEQQGADWSSFKPQGKYGNFGIKVGIGWVDFWFDRSVAHVSFYVGIAQCELLSAQLNYKMSLFEIFELVPFGDNCLGFGNLFLRKTLLQRFAGWLFSFAVVEFVPVD